jgi:hypothetical protein
MAVMGPLRVSACVCAWALFAAGHGFLHAATAPRPLAPRDIDSAVRAEWRRRHITPAPTCDDATFVRRASLDLSGRIPTAERVRAFLADRRPDKRARLVDELLAAPSYADHFASELESLWIDRRGGANQLFDRGAFHRYLVGELERNRPWHELVHDLLAATGQNSSGGVAAKRGEAPTGPPDPAIHPAVNWLLQYDRRPQDLAGAVARLFLGLRIQCAQCHDHPDGHYTRNNFRALVAPFLYLDVVPVDTGKTMGIRRVLVADGQRPHPRGESSEELRTIAKTWPRALDGTDLQLGSAGPRQALADWVTSPRNRAFARAAVNRIWGRLLGHGFVDPVDDFRAGNPAVLPDLLDRLSDDFVARGEDLKQLVRTICATQAYQLASASAQAHAAVGERVWQSFALRPLGADELADSIVVATGLDATLAGFDPDRQVRIKRLIATQVGFLFDIDESIAPRAFEGTIPQALLLLNGSLVASGTHTLPSGTLAQLLSALATDDERIETLYLRALSRRPTPAERLRWLAFVNAPPPPVATAPLTPAGAAPSALDRLAGKPAGRLLSPKQAAYEDLLWALVNSSEFMFQH